ncbi:MAG: carboxysome shell carbonic anhydrase [Gammaproteobacteria bacterium]
MQRLGSQLKRRRLGTGTAPLRRPGAQGSVQGVSSPVKAYRSSHPLCQCEDNFRLYEYESNSKAAFDNIVPVLKEISALQHEPDFGRRAQQIAQRELGFELPDDIIDNAWVEQLDMKRLYAWCVFQTYRRYCDEFYGVDPLVHQDERKFDEFVQSCGFHTVDVSPCADGRLAHVIRYVLRMPHRMVRRKSYAGAMFDIDDSIEKWVETEMLRFREGRPNTADMPTRYLKVVAYHYSSVDPLHQGCAAHGSDDEKAAASGLERLNAFKTAIENSFCCGASIDLLLIGVDTDTDSIRVHVPDGEGVIHLDRFVDTLDVYKVTQYGSATEGREFIANQVRSCSPEAIEGTAKFSAYLIENNLSQIDYVRKSFGEAYPDTGHAERFIGAGVGFEEIQLRNLMYFAYLNTVEEAIADTDVGIKIFTGLNVSKGLPVPVVVRFDYHGHVPGARERAQQHCQRVARAFNERYAKLAEQGLLHILQVARDCNSDASIEVLECSVNAVVDGGH